MQWPRTVSSLRAGARQVQPGNLFCAAVASQGARTQKGVRCKMPCGQAAEALCEPLTAPSDDTAGAGL
jgi:hypothetical protein